MTVFVSYSRRDEQAAVDLLRTLEKAQFPVWVDQQLRGGESWWQEVLSQIRRCSVFVLALSDNSLQSTPCRSELDYAMRLGVPVLPVQVGPASSIRSSSVANLQVVNYSAGHPNAGVELMVALNERQAARPPLPDPLPPPPPIPFEYLARLRRWADRNALGPADQDQVLTELRRALRDEHDADARTELVAVARRLRARADITVSVAEELDRLLSSAGPPRQADSTAPAGWYPDPSQPQQQRWWDGRTWTSATQPLVGSAGSSGAPGPPRRQSRTGLVVALSIAAVVVLVVVALAVAGGSGGSGGGPTQSATDTGSPPTSESTLTAADQNYLANLARNNVVYSSTDNVISEGHGVCTRLGNGNNLAGEANHFEQEGYSEFESGFIVGSAILAYCPEYRSLLPSN